MLFIASFEDDPDALQVRDAHNDGHMAFLAKHADQIVAAGPLRNEPDGAPVGALWFIEAPNRRTVEALIDEDPFWINGLRKSRSIMQWHRVVPDRPVSI
jgi:hypothetical protein